MRCEGRGDECARLRGHAVRCDEGFSAVPAALLLGPPILDERYALGERCFRAKPEGCLGATENDGSRRGRSNRSSAACRLARSMKSVRSTKEASSIASG